VRDNPEHAASLREHAIEPIDMVVVNLYQFEKIAARMDASLEELIENIARQGHIHFPEVPEKWQRVFVTAHDISPEWHVRMQASFQQHCDSAISKTTNFPHTATPEDVRAIYELAYELKCKGVTVYRDGSRDNQVLSTGATDKAKAERDGLDVRGEVGDLKGTIAELNTEIERLRIQLFDVEAENLQSRKKRARPNTLRGMTTRIETPLGTMFVNITEDEKGQPFEVFINLGKAGGAAMADVEAIGRLISLSLRSGIPIKEVHRQLRGIASDRAIGLGPNKVMSVPDAIGIALENWMREKQGIQQELLKAESSATQGAPGASVTSPATVNAASTAMQAQYEFEKVSGAETFIGTCPDCGSSMEFAEGCAKCHVCGYSECG